MAMTRSRSARSGMGITLLIIALMGAFIAIMLIAYGTSTHTASRTRSTAKLGYEAKIACTNAIEEAAYHFITRSNSPRLSKKDKTVDLYTAFRSSVGDDVKPLKLEYELPPIYARRLGHQRRIAISDVKVRVATEAYEAMAKRVRRFTYFARDLLAAGQNSAIRNVNVTLNASSAEEGERISREVREAQREGTYEALRDNVLEGEGAEWCDVAVDVITFEPVKTVAGVVEFSCTARVVGPNNAVERRIVQRRSVNLTQLTEQAELSVVRLSPNRICTYVTRRVSSKKDEPSKDVLAQAKKLKRGARW